MEIVDNKTNLWVFGDSFSMPFENAIKNNWFKEYINKLNVDIIEMWPNIVKNKLNLNIINTAVGGSDNYTIFEKFCENSINIKNGDFIVLNWSNINRFRIPIDDKFSSVLVEYIDPNLLKKNIFTENELNKISITRNHKLFQNEVNMWSLFINEFCKLKNVKILFWGICDQQAYFFLNLWKYMNKRGTIKDDYPELGNYHFSIDGHKLFSELVIKQFESSQLFEYQSTDKFIKM